MPTSTTRPAPSPTSWLARYQAAMEPLFKRADEALACARAAVKHSRELHGRAAETCIYCGGSARHSVWCIDVNMTRPATA